MDLHRPYSIPIIVSAYECCVMGSIKVLRIFGEQQPVLEVLPVLGRGCLMHGIAYLLHSGLSFGSDVELPGFYRFL